MKRLSLMFLLLMVLAVVSYGQGGAYYNYSTNGNQACDALFSGCWTPWATSSASCYSPNVGPGGWRIVGGSVSQYASCALGNAYATIDNNPPGNWYLNWYGYAYNSGDVMSYYYSAYSACIDTTDGSGNYAANTGDYSANFGC